MKEIQMASPSAVRQVLQAHGLATKKNWGQSFLTDGAVAESIAAQVPPGNLLYEIGPGLGALSQFLLPRTCLLYTSPVPIRRTVDQGKKGLCMRS